ncbi:MAG: peptidylprolyl isomerase [Myxococcales bacterium]|nr:peptidylprolyl isomerase [Myxococcales bacterium]
MSVAVDGSVITFHYTLKDDDGEVLDTSIDEEPMAALQGAQNVVPGLEKALAGKKAGDKFSVSVSPEEGYGEKAGPGPQAVSKDQFPDDVDVEAGMMFLAEGDDGHPFPLWVTDVTKTEVMVDTNHPLAGQTLHFDIEVLAVRKATAEEMDHGHVHGPGGHHHH